MLRVELVVIREAIALFYFFKYSFIIVNIY